MSILRSLSCVLVPLLLGPSAGAERPLAYLLQSDGLVELKREAWTAYHPAQAGVGLHAGDFLRLADDAGAVALCTDFGTSPWRPSPGEFHAVERACPHPIELLDLPDGLSAAPRGVDAEVVRVLSPRGRVRRDDQSALIVRWRAAQGEQFDIRLLAGRRAVWGWARVLRHTEWEIPGEAPLEPDRPYWAEIRHQGRVYATEIPFVLVNDKTRSRIANEEATLLGLLAREDAGRRDLAHALYLVHQHLWDEALTLLGDADLAPTAATELLRGRLALGLGLDDIAEERLTTAQELARSGADVESEAAALVVLAATARTKEEGKERLREALALYEKLGDVAPAEDVRRRLASM